MSTYIYLTDGITIIKNIMVAVKKSNGMTKLVNSNLFVLMIPHRLCLWFKKLIAGIGAKRNDLFRDYFERKVSEGKTSGQAMVCIMRRLVNIIYGMMKNKTAYVHPIVSEPIPAKVA